MLPLLLQAELPPGPGNIWFPIAFVFITMAVAALVAAGGDRMGHRAARRKLRIGKLRPRHVSTLIAVVTGMLISLVTFGIVFIVWADFRNALLQYDNLNGLITKLNSEVEETRSELRTTEAAFADAQARIAEQSETLEVQGAELVEKTQTISETRARAAEAQSKLGQLESQRSVAQRRLTGLEAAIREAVRRRDTAEAAEELRLNQLRVQALEDIRQLDAEIEAMHAELARADTGQQVIGVGEQLAHIQVLRSQHDQIEELLEQKLTELKGRLEQQGLDFDPTTRDNLMTLLARELVAGRDYLVVIRAASNVFAGERVTLAFDLQPLAALVNSGDVVLDIMIGENTARITGLGGVTREVSVPAQFDGASLIEFAVESQGVFTAGARARGFVPDVQTGEFGSPVDRLVDVADELLTRARPLRIQFVAPRALTAVDSLADAQVYLNNPPVRETPSPVEPTVSVDADATPSEPEEIAEPEPDEGETAPDDTEPEPDDSAEEPEADNAS